MALVAVILISCTARDAPSPTPATTPALPFRRLPRRRRLQRRSLRLG